MKEYDLILAPLISLSCVAIGLVIYLNDKKNSAGKTVAVISVSIGIWILSAFLSDIVKDVLLSVLLNRLIFVGLFFLFGGLMYLPFVFPQRSNFAKYLKLPLVIFSILFGSVSLASPWIVKGITFESWGSNIEYGKLFIIFTIFGIAAIAVSLTKFILNYIKLGKEERKKIFIFFEGLFAFMFMTLLVHIVIRRIVGSDEYYRFGNYSAIIFIGFTAYAIVKQQLFNIKVILTEIAVAIVGIVIFEEIFLSNSITVLISNLVLFGIVSYGGYILIKSVIHEIEQKEELEVTSLELTRANEKLKKVDAMKTEFVSLASHELLTPISAIEGYLSMILDEKMVKVDDPKAVQYLGRISKSARRLTRLVTDLLNVSRIEEGRLSVEKKDCDLAELIDSAVSEIKVKADVAKVSLEVEIPPESKVKVFVDADKIKEVIINLISNSIKYSKEAGWVKVRAGFASTAEVLAAEKHHNECSDKTKDSDGSIGSTINEKYRTFIGSKQLVISVVDNGIGVDSAECGHLFKKFSRIGDWSTQKVQGTGLGLYISKALVEMHHGRIWVESEGLGKGSTFCFSLPVYESKSEVEKLDAQVPKSQNAKPLAMREHDVI